MRDDLGFGIDGIRGWVEKLEPGECFEACVEWVGWRGGVGVEAEVAEEGEVGLGVGVDHG